MKKYILYLMGLVAGGAAASANVSQSVDSVFAPVIVAAGPSDAYIGLSKMPDGELRHYNYGEQAEPGSFYLSSRDNGLTWKKVNYPEEMPMADLQSPISGEWIRLLNMGRYGVYCIRTVGGETGNRTVSKVSDLASIMIKPPVFIRDGKRIVVAAHGGVNPKGSYTYISDDDGLSWQQSNTVTVPDHKGGGFHQGIRWNHGAVEPTVIELNDGRLWMLVRTPHDVHYESFSDDGGLSWSEARPSQFYGTITMPTLGRLADGRMLLFWCNTTPMPELPTANGVWDDVFTNRDVTHIAISEDDGGTWTGFRELSMDALRNEPDYALRGKGKDRGMHQAQFVEVEPGKIIAAIGQHPLHRQIIAFDTDWIYEGERTDSFANGLANWSTFNYIKGIKGHCSYNRINGVNTIAHPDRKDAQVMDLHYAKADTLVSDIRGAVWNFPSMRHGEFTTSVKVPRESDGVTLVLNDRWFNPSDTVARYEGIYRLKLDRPTLGIRDDGWHDVTVTWDIDRKGKPEATLTVDGKKRKTALPQLNESIHGLSYAHFLAEPKADGSIAPGIQVEKVAARRLGKR